MEVSQRIDELEGDQKILKNQIQESLLDIREHILTHFANPFQSTPTPVAVERSESKSEDVTQLTEKFSELQSEIEALKKKVEAAGAVSIEAPIQVATPSPEVMGQVRELNQKIAGLESEMITLKKKVASLERMPEPIIRHGATQQEAPRMAMQSAGSMPNTPNTAQDFGPGPGPGPAPHEPTHGMSPAQGAPPGQWGGDQGPSFAPTSRSQRDEPTGAVGEVSERSPEGIGRRMRRKGTPADPTEPDKQETQMNLLTLIGLGQWVERSMKKIGKSRVEAIVEIYDAAGYLPPNHKEVIAQLIRLANEQEPDEQVAIGESISALLQFDNLLEGKYKNDAAALSTLFGNEGSSPWIKP